MLILAINLDRSTDRWSSMQRSLAAIGVDAERVPGVDGSDLEQEYIESITAGNDDHDARGRYPRELSRGEVGCFLSHRKCWNMLVESGESHAVIMEDDLLVSPRAAQYLKDLSWLPKNVDLCKLSSLHKKWLIRIGRDSMELPFRHLNPESGEEVADRLVEPLSKRLGTQCYIISRKAAAYAIEHSNRLGAPVDQFLFSLKQPMSGCFRLWMVTPVVAVQAYTAPTTIRKREEGRSRRSLIYIRNLPSHLVFSLRAEAIARARGVDFESLFL